MARNTVDFCIICGCLPCKCMPKPAKKTATRKVVKSPPTSMARTVHTVRAPVLAAPSTPTRPTRPNLSTIRSVKSDDDLEFERAITVLAAADLLHYEHLMEYRQVIDLPPHKIDAMIWRQRANG